MKFISLIFILLATLITILVLNCSQSTEPKGNLYISEGLTFHCSFIKDDGQEYEMWYNKQYPISPTNPYCKSDGFVFSAKFLGFSDSSAFGQVPDEYRNSSFTFRLVVLAPNDTIRLSVAGVTDTILLSVDSTYDFYGAPSIGGPIYSKGCLSIFYKDSLLLEGNGYSHFEDTSKHLIKLKTDSILSSCTTSDEFIQYTNERIMFYTNSDTLKLIQGRSGILGDFRIYLGVARKIDQIKECADCGGIGLSYSICRIY